MFSQLSKRPHSQKDGELLPSVDESADDLLIITYVLTLE